MNKLKIWLLCCATLLSIAACGTDRAADIQDSGKTGQGHGDMKQETVQGQEVDVKEQSQGFSMSDSFVRISMEGHTATFRLYDATAAKEFYDQLPLTLET